VPRERASVTHSPSPPSPLPQAGEGGHKAARPFPSPACGRGCPEGAGEGKPALWPWLLLALALIALDQASKLTVDGLFAYGERIRLLPFFDLTLLYNTGAAFSFLAGAAGWQRWFFTLLALAACVFIVWLMRRHRGQPRFNLALSLILGGAIGNLIDRSVYGHVVDFLLFYWRDWHFPAFNVADAGITCGAVLLVIDELLRGRKP